MICALQIIGGAISIATCVAVLIVLSVARLKHHGACNGDHIN